MISAADKLQSRTAVFRSQRMARRKLSWLRLPGDPVLEVRRRLAVLTATSARPFDCGKWAEEMWCLIPQRLRRFSVHPAVNSGPPSDEIYSGTPNVAKNNQR